MSKKKKNREAINELIENALWLLNRVESRKYLFPVFYNQIKEHLKTLDELKSRN